MTKKERAISAMLLKPVDRIPSLYRGVIPFSKRLMKYFGIGKPDDPIILLRYHKKLLNALGADFWTIGSCQYFSNFVPSYIGPEIDYMDQPYFSTLGIKTSTKYLKDYNYNYMVIEKSPLGDYDDPAKVKGYLTNRLDFFDYGNCINQQLNNKKDSPYFNNSTADEMLDYNNLKGDNDILISVGNIMCYPFMLCSYLRGMENFLLDMATNKRMAEAIINEVVEFSQEFNFRFLNNTQVNAEVYSSWDDVAGQDGLMFSPDLFKKYFLPFWKKLVSFVKSKNLIFNWHCCGDVNEVLPLMIDAGIDVFDVVQTSAKDMEIEKFYKNFGKLVCINGGIDVQKLLISGKPKDIREEVKKIKDLWGLDGGAIIGPSHEVLPETPIENVLEIYKS